MRGDALEDVNHGDCTAWPLAIYRRQNTKLLIWIGRLVYTYGRLAEEAWGRFDPVWVSYPNY
jgi:hypothetical protein